MPTLTVIEAVREAMREEMRRDSSVFVLGEDVGRRGGVFLATQGFVDEFGEQRVIDTPLAEAAIAGVAVGAAMAGMRRASLLMASATSLSAAPASSPDIMARSSCMPI